MAFKPAPLNSTFFLAGIIGFIIAATYVIPAISVPWGVAFSLVFFAMIVASLYTMRRAPLLDEHIVPEFTEPVVERFLQSSAYHEEPRVPVARERKAAPKRKRVVAQKTVKKKTKSTRKASTKKRGRPTKNTAAKRKSRKRSTSSKRRSKRK